VGTVHKVADWNGPQDQAYVTDGRTLEPATDEVLARVAREAMLLSQGVERAEQLLAQAQTAAKRPPTAA